MNLIFFNELRDTSNEWKCSLLLPLFIQIHLASIVKTSSDYTVSRGLIWLCALSDPIKSTQYLHYDQSFLRRIIKEYFRPRKHQLVIVSRRAWIVA